MFCSPYPDFTDIKGKYYVIPITLISAVIALIGNALVLTVIIKHDGLRSQSAYRFIASLSFADILVSVLAQPLYVLVILPGSGHNCWLERVSHFVGSLSSSASALGLLIVSIDRLFFITRPLHYYSIMTSLRVKIGIAYIWVNAVFLALLPYITSIKAFHIVVFTATIANAIVTGYCYSTIYLVVSRSVGDEVINMQNRSRRQHQATRTVAFILLAMAICWLPYIVSSFVWALRKNEWGDDAPIISVYFWLLALGHWNSSVNVVIYSWKNSELRIAIKRFIGMKEREDEQVSSQMREERHLHLTVKEKKPSTSLTTTSL